MANYLAEHWALSILITILLGAIGSGLWDAAFKPAGTRLGSFIFRVLTLNARRSRDRVYRNAAMGHHEVPSLYVFLIVIMFGVGALTVSQTRLYTIIYKDNLAPEFVLECEETNHNDRGECVREALKVVIAPKLYFMSFISLFLVVLISYRFMSINRTNLVVTYYQQSLKSIRPYLSDIDYYLFEQKFSLIEGKDDYDAIISSLEKIAADNNSKLPASYVHSNKKNQGDA